MKVAIGQTKLGPDLRVDETVGQEDLKDKLQSDFEKDGKPASWAEGYPKQWGTEHWRFSTGKDRNQAVSSASATSDEKFLTVSRISSICIFSLDEFKLACVLKTNLALVHKLEFARVPRGKDGYLLACNAQKDLSGRESEVQVWFLDKECKQKRDLDEKTAPKNEDWKMEGKFPPFAPSALSTDCTKLLCLSEVHDKWGLHARVVAADVGTGKEIVHMQGHTEPIMWAGFSPDDKLIATTSWDGSCKLYDAKTGKHIRDYGPTGGQNLACDFSIDSKNLAVSRGSGAGPNTFVWRTDDPRSFPITLQGTRGWQRSISWSPDGRRLAIGAADMRLIVYDARSMTLEQVWQLAEAPERRFREVTEVKWLEGGKKILFKPTDGNTQMYDFERNLKCKWGPGKGRIGCRRMV
jgi:WD40 repeat protein